MYIGRRRRSNIVAAIIALLFNLDFSSEDNSHHIVTLGL
jgi:hypothetical protein